jgi:hypothetical protein
MNRLLQSSIILSLFRTNRLTQQLKRALKTKASRWINRREGICAFIVVLTFMSFYEVTYFRDAAAIQIIQTASNANDDVILQLRARYMR